MDLSKLDTVASSNDGAEIQLYHPVTREALSIFITVLGKDSDQYRKTMSEQLRKRLQKNARGGVVKPMTPEELEQEAITLLAACTKGWRDGDGAELSIGDERLAFSKENAASLYARFPWIKEQVDEAVMDRANFSQR